MQGARWLVMTSAACASFVGECASPSAVVARARRSRSGSASRDIDRSCLGERHVLDLHTLDMDAPVQGQTVDHEIHALGEMLPVADQVVEIALANDGTKELWAT
jgi:hypothetical protein